MQHFPRVKFPGGVMSGYVVGFWSGFVVMTYSTVQHRLFIQTCYCISLFDNFIKLKQSALFLFYKSMLYFYIMWLYFHQWR